MVLKLVLMGGFALSFFAAIPASAESSEWLQLEDPIIKTVSESASSKAPFQTDLDCLPTTKFVTIPANILKARPESSTQVCAIQTAFGTQATSTSLIQLSGTNVAGPVKTSAGIARPVFPIPNSNHVMYLAGGYYGSNRYIIRDLATKIDTKIQSNGSIFHQLKPDATGVPLTNSSGDLIDFRDNIYSNNGKWMIGEVHQTGLTRINLDTGESLVFGSPFNHGIGDSPKYVAAISGDGRYVLATEDDYNIFKLYDLSTCVLNVNPNKQASCQSKNLIPFIKATIPDFKRVEKVSFSTNYTVKLHIRHANNTYSYKTLSPAGTSESSLDYLALGDSFASGEGTFSYKAETDVRNPQNTCHLSPLSYPYLIIGKTSLNSVGSVACSGARLKDIVNPDYTEYTAQSKGKHEPAHDDQIYSNLLVGYRAQIDFVNRLKPLKITVSIGGNDIGFSAILQNCLEPGTCYPDPQAKRNIAHTIAGKYDELVSVYTAIKQSAASTADVYAIGYPSLAQESGNCGLNVQLNPSELALSNAIIDYLNVVIQKAAIAAGVTYIDVTEALHGHRLCETTSNDIAVSGITAGDDKTFSMPVGSNYTLDGYFSGRESFHPNQLGHRLLADAILQKTNNLRINSPAANPTIVAPTGLESTQLVNSSNINLQPKKLSFRPIVQPVLLRNTPYPIQLSGFAPDIDAIISIPGALSPTNIRTTAAGTLTATLLIPSSAPIGLTTLQLKALNQAGEPIEIHQTIYIAHSSSDIDGDGTLNQHEACPLHQASGVDTDNDTVDDACDPSVSNPKPSVILATSNPTTRNTPVATSSEQPVTGELKMIQQRQSTILRYSKTGNQPAVLAKTTPPLLLTKVAESRSVVLAAITASTLLLIISALLLKKWRNRS